MKILGVGATGRVGQSVVEFALAADHSVVTYVRKATKVITRHPNLTVIEGEVSNSSQLNEVLTQGIEAVVNVVGGPVDKPSTVVTDTARYLIVAMGVRRYLGITGTAEMPDKTLLGKITTAVLRLTPIGHAARDHDSSYALVSTSGLDWTFAGCPYIKDGQLTRSYRLSATFFGGFKTISPQDVADFLVKELAERRFPQQVVGIWY